MLLCCTQHECVKCAIYMLNVYKYVNMCKHGTLNMSSNIDFAADESLPLLQVEDSHVYHHLASAASLADDGLDVDHALLPLGTEDSHLPNRNSTEAAEPIHSSGLRDRLNHDTELDAIFTGKASVPSARSLIEGYDRPASMGDYESAMPLEPAWLTDRERAVSPLDNVSPDTYAAVNELIRCANPRQDQRDSCADYGNFTSSNVPDLHELFGGRGHQMASLHASVDAAWADEPNSQTNKSKSGFW